jgi:hypothetical protein
MWVLSRQGDFDAREAQVMPITKVTVTFLSEIKHLLRATRSLELFVQKDRREHATSSSSYTAMSLALRFPLYLSKTWHPRYLETPEI